MNAAYRYGQRLAQSVMEKQAMDHGQLLRAAARGALPGAVAGGALGYLHGDPKHKLKSTLTSAGAGGVLGAGIGAGWNAGVQDHQSLQKNHARFMRQMRGLSSDADTLLAKIQGLKVPKPQGSSEVPKDLPDLFTSFSSKKPKKPN